MKSEQAVWAFLHFPAPNSSFPPGLLPQIPAATGAVAGMIAEDVFAVLTFLVHEHGLYANLPDARHHAKFSDGNTVALLQQFQNQIQIDQFLFSGLDYRYRAAID